MRSKTAVLLLAIASGCASPRYLAKVDGAELTGADLKHEFKRRHAGHQSFLADEGSIRKFVQRLVDYKLLVLEAYRLGLDDDPELQRAVERFEASRLLEHMAKVELEAKSQVSPEEIQHVYDTQLQDVLNVRQLVVPTRDEAEALRAQAAAGADFETLVRERSTAESRKFGGFMELGWGSLAPAREPVVFALPAGATSPVAETQDGYEILQVVEHRKLEKKPEFTAASPRIKSILQTRKKDELKKQLAATLWAKYQAKIEPFDDSAEALRAVQNATPPSTARVASWAGGEILVRDFAATLKLDAVAALPPETARRELRHSLENMIDPELLKLEARARGYAELPAIVAEVKAYRDGLVENKFEGEFLVKGVTVTDDEVKQYYEKHRDAFVAPEKRHVAHVVVEKPETADEVVKKLAAGDSFEELARTMSKDNETAKRGGTIGWVKPDEAKGDLAAVFQLPEGGTSKPIKSSFGYHVFKVLEITPARPQEFEEVEAACREKAVVEKREAKRADWVARLRASSKIVVSDAGIKKFVADNPVGPNVEAKSLSHGMGGKSMARTEPAAAAASSPQTAGPQTAPADAASPVPAATAPAK